MIRIAVIDDDEIICNELRHIIQKYDLRYEYDIYCDLFISCEDFFTQANNTDYMLIFLDIEFPGMNGIELSRKIRNLSKNMKVQIIFISSKSAYAMELFDVQPFNFLIKPFAEEKVFECLTKYFIYYRENNKLFEYTFENIKYRVPVNEIMYFESNGKKIIMHTQSKEVQFYGVFSELSEHLKQQFVVIKRGLMINLQYVINSNYSSVELSNGTTFQISKNNRENVRNRLCGQ